MRLRLLCLLCPMVVSVALPAAAADPPQFPLHDFAVCDTADISKDWMFREDTNDTGIADRLFAVETPTGEWSRVSAPAVWDIEPGKFTYPLRRQIGWYSRTLNIPAGWTNEIALVFLGAMFATDVWIAEEYMGVHRGGYSPFFFTLPPKVSPGSTARLTVRVDGRLSNETIPRPHMGWQAFGGLCREVYIVHRPLVRPENVRTSATLSKDGSAVFRISGIATNVSAEGWSGDIRITLDALEKTVARAVVKIECAPSSCVPFECNLAVHKPRLWSPDNPFLHTLRIDLPGGGGSLTIPVGLREITIAGGKILVNGRQLWLQGFGEHEEVEGFGPCIPLQLRREMLTRMKNEFRCNTFRPGHYPNDPLLYDLCDELGFLMMAEIPAWQVSGDYLQSDNAWDNWLEPQLREMVVTLRNHASVAFWGVSNEIHGTHKYFRRALEYIRGLDNSRPVTAVMAATSDLESMEFLDMNARNFHYGWYHSRSVYDLTNALASTVAASRGKPIWIAELGAIAGGENLRGGYGDQSRGSQQYQDRVIRYGLHCAATESELVAGISVWTWSDFHKGNGLCAHGVFDDRLIPKLAAYSVCNAFNGDLRVFIREDDCVSMPGKPWNASLRCFNPERTERKQLKAQWRILLGRKTVASGRFAFALDDRRSVEIGNVRWEPSAADDPGIYACWVELSDSKDRWLHTSSAMFDCGLPQGGDANHADYYPGVLEVRMDRDAEPLEHPWVSINDGRFPIYPATGLLLPLKADSYDFTVMSGSRKVSSYAVRIEPGKVTRINAGAEE